MRLTFSAIFLLVPLSITAGNRALASNVQLKDLTIISQKPIGKIDGVGNVMMGGLSGMVLDRYDAKTDTYHFLALSDRGINSSPQDFSGSGKKARMLVFPKYSPLLIELSYSNKLGKVEAKKFTPLLRPNGSPTSGLSNIVAGKSTGAVHEALVGVDKVALAGDPWGIDPESIALDSNGFIWIGEEYGASLLKVARDGRILSRFIPEDTPAEMAGVRSIPAVFSEREANRGFEAVVVKGDSLFAFLQSPIKAKDGDLLVRILEFDVKTEKTKGVYFYRLSQKGVKIGDASLSPDGKIILLEQLVDGGKNISHQALFEVDFSNATNLLTAINSDSVVMNAESKEIVQIGNQVTKNFEKLEGLSVLPNGSFCILNDNDFNADALLSKLHRKPVPALVNNHFFIVNTK
jgi:3-phytase